MKNHKEPEEMGNAQSPPEGQYRSEAIGVNVGFIYVPHTTELVIMRREGGFVLCVRRGEVPCYTDYELVNGDSQRLWYRTPEAAEEDFSRCKEMLESGGAQVLVTSYDTARIVAKEDLERRL